MISRLEVKNFQALKNVTVDLGRFTVVVGDSNCGKSALTRSIQALASNIRGSSFVTHGESVASVTAVLDADIVTLEKGDAHGVYRTVAGSEEMEYTKLGGEVPSAVSELLGLDTINFAAQHDTPFLLKDSGATVARILGDLTNVSTVFEAVREANRRRSSLMAEIRTRQNDNKVLAERINTGKSLVGRKDSLVEAEEFLLQIESVSNQILDLERLINGASYEGVVDQVENVDIQEIENALNDYRGLKALLLSVVGSKEKQDIYAEDLKRASEKYDKVHSEFEESLKEANECPLCGQSLSRS
jgi:DNA repair ATPase RecN